MLNQKPCDVCPYKLGIVKMIISPCPQCQKGGYEFFRQLKEHKKSPLDVKMPKDKKQSIKERSVWIDRQDQFYAAAVRGLIR